MRKQLDSRIVTRKWQTETLFAEIDSPSFQQQAEELLKQCSVERIQWIRQVHGNGIIAAPVTAIPQADGSYTRSRKVACAVRSADCLPIFLCNHAATQVALLHAGWRGIARGIISSGIRSFSATDKLYASFGPAISAAHYEVGADVYKACPHEDAFTPVKGKKDHWYADIYLLALHQLEKAGVICTPPPRWCTYSETELFYSYRRDRQADYGSIVNLIWIK